MGYGWHAPVVEQHGTLEAWRRHQQNGGRPCASCELAHGLHQEAQEKVATAKLWRDLLDLIAGECKRAGMLPP